SMRTTPRDQQLAQMQPVLVAADQCAHVLAAGAMAKLADLLVDEGLEAIGQRDVHRAHGASVGPGKMRQAALLGACPATPRRKPGRTAWLFRVLVERRRIELPTFALRTRRSPS